ncbi:MAG: hypothetical protein IPP99_18215 [Chitinophagaceae bacterium]|nr:hypothetical protein [Chitinophagaceae bacterium]
MKINTYYRIINAALILSLLVAGLIVFISVTQSGKVAKTGNDITHTQESLRAVNKITTSLLALQSGNRAFLLTGINNFCWILILSKIQLVNHFHGYGFRINIRPKIPKNLLNYLT